MLHALVERNQSDQTPKQRQKQREKEKKTLRVIHLRQNECLRGRPAARDEADTNSQVRPIMGIERRMPASPTAHRPMPATPGITMRSDCSRKQMMALAVPVKGTACITAYTHTRCTADAARKKPHCRVAGGANQEQSWQGG